MAPQNIILAAAWIEGLSTFIVGISVVFISLLLLVAILTLSGKVFEGIDKEKLETEASRKIKPELFEAEKPKSVELEDDLELVAVITASIAASMGTDVDNLQVRSIRKTNNVWNMAGRKDQLYN